MTRQAAIDALLNEAMLSLDELCRAAPATPRWVHEHVAAGLLEVNGDTPSAWRFDTVAVQRVRRIVRLERDFDAVPELAALVTDLEGEIARLRERLARAGLAGLE